MSRILLSLGLAALISPSLAAQEEAWRHQWYWGVQAGVFQYKTPISAAWQRAPSVGGHWLITATRSALYLAYDEILFDRPYDGRFEPDTSFIIDATAAGGLRAVEFSRGRRIQAHIYVVPTDSRIQPYLGGGFTIQQLPDATPVLGTDTLTANQIEGLLKVIDQTSTRAAPVFTAGLQFRLGRLAVYGHYQFMPEGRNFLLTGSQHIFQGGLRYALTPAREEVTTGR